MGGGIGQWPPPALPPWEASSWEWGPGWGARRRRVRCERSFFFPLPLFARKKKRTYNQAGLVGQ
jgi:hypothetical protein